MTVERHCVCMQDGICAYCKCRSAIYMKLPHSGYDADVLHLWHVLSMYMRRARFKRSGAVATGRLWFDKRQKKSRFDISGSFWFLYLRYFLFWAHILFLILST